MDRDTAVKLIQQKCSFRQDKTDAIVAALQMSQATLELGGVMTEAGYMTEVPYFLRVTDQPLVLTAGATSITLPDNFIREAEDEGPWYPNPNGAGEAPVYLDKGSIGAARRTFTTQSGPQIYSLRDTDMFVWPASDEDITLYWTYFARDDALSTNVENKWLKFVPNLLIGHAGQSIAADLRDIEAGKEFIRMKLEGQKQLLQLNVQRESTNRRTAFGRNL